MLDTVRLGSALVSFAALLAAGRTGIVVSGLTLATRLFPLLEREGEPVRCRVPHWPSRSIRPNGMPRPLAGMRSSKSCWCHRTQRRAVEAMHGLRTEHETDISPPRGFVRHDEIVNEIVNEFIIIQSFRRANRNLDAIGTRMRLRVCSPASPVYAAMLRIRRRRSLARDHGRPPGLPALRLC